MTLPDILTQAATLDGTTEALHGVYLEMYELALLPSEVDDALKAIQKATRKTLRVLREDWKAFCQVHDHLAQAASPHLRGPMGSTKQRAARSKKPSITSPSPWNI